ncbi:5-oxoprolinase subunit PxpB [Bacillus sp. REN16]|uniref:5-oxoprolinase subunit PxpB n=1 Tax=Bacillus sp. REN16 TaxID=2887296 RepID=UPI001E2F7586|nr:5-oxoprolinase subunit PxpB [Bacillus sp. REN16]MCC3356309.1 5-oxoprolinase subunit PxpB [Bacillus sp. REN16]
MNFDILPVGDTALQIFYKDPASDALQRQIQQTTKQIEKTNVLGIIELVPAYQSITIYYNPILISYKNLSTQVSEICKGIAAETTSLLKQVIVIPTCYDGEDLSGVARGNGLSNEEVISLHSSVDYLVYMIGFLPGFPYLKGLPMRLATPRLANPRLKVPKGAVGIGGDQTGIYPLESPGGWNLIGRTPVPLFDPEKPEPFLLKAGDYLRFKPITSAEYKEIESLVKKHKYMVEVKKVENN